MEILNVIAHEALSKNDLKELNKKADAKVLTSELNAPSEII
jgi:hypothetical protein